MAKKTKSTTKTSLFDEVAKDMGISKASAETMAASLLKWAWEVKKGGLMVCAFDQKKGPQSQFMLEVDAPEPVDDDDGDS